MRLVHFSAKPIHHIYNSTQENVMDGCMPATVDKPNGLWVSDEDDAVGWKALCGNLQWPIGGFEYDVVLNPEANVLILKNEKELHRFTDDFQADFSDIFGDLFQDIAGKRMTPIDWRKVAAKYDGIIITPYSRGCRFNPFWYYCWDCASGCIWNPSRAIQSVTKRGSKPTPIVDEYQVAEAVEM